MCHDLGLKMNNLGTRIVLDSSCTLDHNTTCGALVGMSLLTFDRFLANGTSSFDSRTLDDPSRTAKVTMMGMTPIGTHPAITRMT